MIELVIFDCDGTLVDSELLCNQALECKLAELGVVIAAQDLVDRFRGVKFNDILATIEDQHSITLPKHFEVNYREKVKALFAESLKANEGVKELLENVQLPICVASSAPRAKIDQALSITGLKTFFNNNIFSCYDIEVWKPQPDIFLHTARKMGYKPKNCLVVEDSPVGIQAAQTAGMNVVLYDPHQTHADIDVEYRVSSMHDIRALLS